MIVQNDMQAVGASMRDITIILTAYYKMWKLDEFVYISNDDDMNQPRQVVVFFFSSRRRHTRFDCDWSSDVCSSDLDVQVVGAVPARELTIQKSILRLEKAGGFHGLGKCIHQQNRQASAEPFVEQIGRASCRERV